VAKAVLIADAELAVDDYEAGLHLSDLNNIVSPWQTLRDVFDQMPDDSLGAWDNIVARLQTIDQPLAGYRQCLEAGIAEGRTAARRQVTVAIEQGRAVAGDDSSFLRLVDRLGRGDIDETDIRARLAAAIDHARASFGAMTDWLEDTYLPASRETDGCGREHYIRSAQRFLGETVDPEERYRWGWSEIRRLTARLELLAAEIDPDASVSEVMAGLLTDPERGAADADEFLAIMQQRQEQALASLDGSHFDVPEPIKRIEVKAAPPGGALAPYYSGPSEDFARPGRVWYPLGDRTFFPLYDEVTTAYHEGFPGHHLQVGWQTAMGDELSRFHRLLTWYPGSGEGWALYAETLMGELGFLEKTEYEIGLVTSQLFRSCRIVIDIGLHCGLPIPDDQPFHPGERWAFDTATEMLRDMAYVEQAMAESEVVRYLGWPGQAISYKIGEQAILDLRAEMRKRPDFDLKKFHADVLSVGSTGLDLLRELVRSA
jgi:uncharacterized protein (DUF885 family)